MPPIFTKIFLILILINVVHLEIPHLHSERVWSDEAFYAWVSQYVLHDPSYLLHSDALLYHPPLFPIILSLGQFINPGLLGMKFVVFLIGLFGIFATYYVGKKMYGDFVGLVSALLLSICFHYIFLSGIILADIPLTTGYLILISVLISNKESGQQRRHWIVGVVICGLILLKWSGLIAMVLTAIVYPFVYKGLNKKDLIRIYGQTFICPLMLVFGMLICGFFPETSALKGVYFKEEGLFYFKNIDTFLPSKIFYLVLLLGIVALVKDKTYSKWIVIIWILTVYIICSFANEKVARYVLPAVPGIFIICALGFQTLVNLLGKAQIKTYGQIICVIFLLLYALIYKSDLQALYSAHEYGYSGYPHAGKWIQTHVASNARIYTSARRTIRLFSGIDFYEYNGQLELPSADFSEFLNKVKSSNRPVYLVIDVWEAAQPKWIFPLTDEKVQKIMAAGFVLETNVYHPNKDFNSPIIGIFQYQP